MTTSTSGQSPGRLRPRITWTNVAFTYAAIAALLSALGLVAGFVGETPRLGWLGFGVVSAVVGGIGGAAAFAIPRLRVSPPEPAVAHDRARRLLVVADPHCSEPALCDQICASLGGAKAVQLVVPVRVSHLRFLADDEAEERRAAEQSMQISVGLLRERGAPAAGSVGTDKPLESMTDALGWFPATDVLLAIPPEGEAYWLERGLLAKARALTAVTVDQVVVPAQTPVGEPTHEKE